MANRVGNSPPLPRPPLVRIVPGLTQYLASLNRALIEYLSRMATRVNGSVPLDGSEAMTGALPLPVYTVATLPDASTAGKLIYVSDESGGAVVAFSDATNWRRVTDRAIVS